MNTLKKLLGIVWILLGPAAIIYMLYRAIHEMNTVSTHQATETIMFWIISIAIFIPIAIGFMIFGWYAIKGEYHDVSE